MMCYSTERVRNPRRGSLLVAVLAILFLGTVLVFRFVEEGVQELQYRGQIHQDPELRLAAYSAFEVSLAVLQELRTLDERLAGPAQGWGNPLGYAGYSPPEGLRVNASIRDETGKLSLHRMNEDILPILFEEMGLPFTDSQRLTDTLLDWMDEDDLTRLNGAESDYYLRRDPPYRAANRPIRNWEELRLIAGFDELFFDENGTPNAFHRQFVESVSLIHDSRPNLNTAPPLVLRFVARMEGFDPRNLERYLREENGLLFSRDNPYYSPPAQASQAMAAIEGSVFQIHVSSQRGDTRIEIEAVVRHRGATGGSASPFDILHLTENHRL